MLNTRDADSPHAIPYIKEVEYAALNLLKKNPNNKEELKEILENYASRYAREHNIRT